MLVTPPKVVPTSSISPRYFGAKCDGVTDDTAPVQKAFDWAIDHLGTVTVDVDGVCAISAPIVVKPGGFAHFKGQLKALPTFPLHSYMIRADSQSGGLVHHDLSFDMVLDANWRGGCVHVDNYIRVHFAGTCRVLHYIDKGILLDKTIDSHEATIDDGLSAFEYLYGESSPGYMGETSPRDWQHPTATSVGVQVNSFDNYIGAMTSYYSGTGLIINGQYNIVTGAHLGGVQFGMTIGAAFVSAHQVYIDSASVLITDPWNTELIGCKFLSSTTDTNFKFVLLRPTKLGQALTGLKITGCSFHNTGTNAVTVRDVVVDTSGSKFDFASGQVRQCYIGGNSHINCTTSYTELTRSLYQNASLDWEIDFALFFPFGAVQYASFAFYDQTNSNPISNITSIGATKVKVHNTVAGNGTMYITAGVNVLS